MLLLGRYKEILQRQMSFRLLATKKILSMLEPECSDAASILRTNMLFLKDLFGLDDGDLPEAALSNELQSLSLIQPNVSISTASLQVKIVFFRPPTLIYEVLYVSLLLYKIFVIIALFQKSHLSIFSQKFTNKCGESVDKFPIPNPFFRVVRIN